MQEYHPYLEIIKITQHHNQREYILIELITFNPNKKSLVTHCHGNLTR